VHLSSRIGNDDKHISKSENSFSIMFLLPLRYSSSRVSSSLPSTENPYTSHLGNYIEGDLTRKESKLKIVKVVR
jgi:hypothetical protein